MKRNVISLIKFLFVATFAVLLTIVVFRYVRGPRLSIAGSPHSLNIFEGDKNYPNGQLEEKIDWHDYKKMKEDSSRVGIGEQGKPATLSPSKRLTEDKLYKVNGFNAALSDEISLNRSVPDIRHPDCKKKTYLKNLNSVSVIVSFHNEHFTTLLRTCWSVINRSPPKLLEEIILVDDASTKVELKDKLDRYLASNLPKVSVIRLTQRSGLIRGRLAGAKKAKAKILVFLDSHTEANVNWLPPLIEPITKDYKTCVCPFIDVIAFDTFEYRAQDEGARGAFDWELYYKRLPLLPADLANPSEPFKNPVMAGGLFAISAKFFWELGGYDPGLDIWGGEQYELSFKIWQCGGQMFDAPCSRVAHIYRKFAPFPNPGKGDFLGRNYKRVAQVWMDEFAEYIYKRRPHLRSLDPGDLTVQKALREKLNCKPFKWFMENIAFDLMDTYPPVEPEDFALGEIRNIGVSELCLDAKRRAKNEAIAVDLCVKDNVKVANGEQEFRLTWRKDIRPKTRTDCLDVSSGVAKAPVTLYPCHGQQGNQRWRYDVEKQWLLHGLGDRCLDTDPATKKVFVSACDPASSTQKWRIHEVNMKAINNWENVGPKL
ncbi:Similar to Pgant6: N-acetylgalactosaminyltransferase 6 (Drosophila melanogaster) [Cotesia congregata]|uniref:Polypeptide N-acetylgalactosaminyltransferase n=1 Tax=Cotesia congregata TaxID=51543 RepID=A0A8J2MV45_COTCN|nr:Similar to Pgant6: N-acetylgalactosaminyltransferase 6 (Drosophila melanogaster) [Cotesia congregata]